MVVADNALFDTAMKKTTFSFLFLTAAGSLLSSCVYYTPAVADMPYKSGSSRSAYPNTWVTQPPATPNAAAAVPAPALPPGSALGTLRPTSATPAPATPQPAPVPAPVAQPAATPAPAPVAAPATTKPLDLTKPAVTPTPEPAKPAPVAAPTPAPAPKPVVTPPAPTPAPAPAPAPAAAAKPAVSASAAAAGADPKTITNQGPIPVATRVEGDPTRVYNPLDPSKTIRVTDKTGKPYPSGKELKVRGTNFHFYVP